MTLLLPVSTFANSFDNTRMEPYSLYTNSLIAELAISSSGTVTASILRYINTTMSVKVNAYLQQYSEGSWKNIGSWSQSSNSTSTAIRKITTVSKRYKYRLKASYYAYSGSRYENIIDYSKVVSY